MPIPTPEDAQLLAELARPEVATIGQSRLKKLLALCWRCINGAKAAEEAAQAHAFVASALWLAASGTLTEEMIRTQPRLSAEQKSDCLALLQMRYDAEAWRAHTEFVLPPLPAAIDVEPIPA